jgi:hypothetical protein
MRSALLAALVLVPALSAGAGDLVAGRVDRHEPAKLPKDGEKRLIQMYGEKQGKEMWAVTTSQVDAPFYSVVLINEDLLRRAVRAELAFEFLDKQGRPLGRARDSFEIAIEPGEDKSVRIDCKDAASASADLRATVLKAISWPEVRRRGEIAFQWHDTRYLEDRWEAEKRRSCAPSVAAYTDPTSDGRVFPAGGWNNDNRFYRVAREAIPGGTPKDSDLYDVDAYGTALLPGIKVEDGQLKKPGFLDTDVVNSETKGWIAVGEPVVIKEARLGKKDLVLVLAPLCAKEASHRWLRGVAKFVMPKERLKGPDSEFVEGVIRPWLEPISVRQVAEVCGPNSGTLVALGRPPPRETERELGPADARAETAKGEVLAYGTVKLRFVDGKLAGFEGRPAR